MRVTLAALTVLIASTLVTQAKEADSQGLVFYVACEERPRQEGLELPARPISEAEGPTSRCVLPATAFRFLALKAVEAQEGLGLWNPDADPPGREKEPRVLLVLRPEDAQRFYTWTKRQVGRHVVLAVNGEAIFAARMLGAIRDRKLQLKVDDDMAAARALASDIRGSVPVDEPSPAR